MKITVDVDMNNEDLAKAAIELAETQDEIDALELALREHNNEAKAEIKDLKDHFSELLAAVRYRKKQVEIEATKRKVHKEGAVIWFDEDGKEVKREPLEETDWQVEIGEDVDEN